MSGILDWSRFKNGAVGRERAYEAFTAQLFERWLRRTYGTRVTSYVLHGAGGDGGVEAFARLEGGSVDGLQAKWFPDTLDAKRIAQIRESLDTARRRFPTLRHYMVALPLNLTKGLDTDEKKKKKGGVERWDELVAAVAKDYLDLTLVRWDEGALLAELSIPENHELKPLWFEGDFDGAKLQLAWDKAKAKLGDRYLPDLHAVGSLEETLRSDLWTADWFVAARRSLAEAKESLRRTRATFDDIGPVLQTKGTAEFRDAFAGVRAAVERLQATAVSLGDALVVGPRLLPPPEQVHHILSTFAAELELFEKQEHYWGSMAEIAFKSVRTARQRLFELHQAIDDSARLRLIAGPSGCGKTHALANVVQRITEGKGPAVFLMAKGADLKGGVTGLLSAALDLPGWPLARILDGLEALAILHQTAPPAGEKFGFVRTMIGMDGLEETGGWELWSPILAELTVEAARRPRIHFVASGRPETFERLTVPAEAARLYLEEDGGTDLPGLLDSYAAQYRVNVSSVPWLGWALRNPLEIRLLAEEYAGRKVSPGTTNNLLTLFRRKLARVETEARSRAAPTPWSERLGLVVAVLDTLSDLLVHGDVAAVADPLVIKKVCELDSEFTAERVRGVLNVLDEHGLVQIWQPPSSGLRQAPPEYTLATRHIADFLIARQCFDAVVPTLSTNKPVSYPEVLRSRYASAVLFAAHLAERGAYVVDVSWEKPPRDGLSLHAEALTLVPFAIAVPRAAEIRALLTRTTAINRMLVDRLVLPSSRIPDHPLGARTLDEALRAQPLTQRDPIWSVPDDLEGEKPWKGSYSEVLNSIALDPNVDRWDGRPLIAVWNCSSVVEARRRDARERLAVWGARRVDDMTRLVEHMAGVDDAQILADLMIAALGAACGSGVGDRALISLAILVDKLFFAPSAAVSTTCVVVRFAARGIIERAALFFPAETNDILSRCRPPYPPRGGAWPPLDKDEARESSHFGGLVHGDLTWYVADGCFQKFAQAEPYSRETGAPEIDHALGRAIAAGELIIPGGVASRNPAAEEESAVEKSDDNDGVDEWLAKLSHEELLALLAEHREVREKPRHSPEFDALMTHAAADLGLAEVDPKSVRNSMLAHLVRSWGWSEEAFEVDRAIVKTHGISIGSHGSRSAIAPFREKYVWSAVHIIAGALGDRMPIWSDEDHEWRRADAMDDFGNGMPDPLPHLLNDDGPPPDPAWAPPDILPEYFGDEADLPKRAERWLTQAPLPDPTTFIRGSMEGFTNSAVLALSHMRRGHQSCLDQHLKLSVFGVRPEDLPLLKRDARFLDRDMSDDHARVRDGSYISPAIACWAPWISWTGHKDGYNSLNDRGEVHRVRMLPLVGEFTTRIGTEYPTAWIAAPGLGTPLGTVAMHGSRYRRTYVDRKGSAVIVERDVPFEEFLFDNHYLTMDMDLLRATLRDEGLVPVWAIRLCREANAAVFMKGDTRFDVPEDLKHRSRNVTWLIIGSPDGEETVLVGDILEPWESRRDDEMPAASP
jgi:hypothetical protein